MRQQDAARKDDEKMSCTLIACGRVGRIETRTVGDQSVTRFSVACATAHKDENGQYLSEWTNFDAWGKTGEYVAKYIQKGDVVEVQAEKFTRKKGEQYFTNFTVSRCDRIMKHKPAEGEAAPAQPAAQSAAKPAAAAPTIEDDDIPF